MYATDDELSDAENRDENWREQVSDYVSDTDDELSC